MGVYYVTQSEESSQRFWSKFHDPRMAYVEEQYGAPIWMYATKTTQATSESGTSIDDVKKLTSAIKFVEAIRRHGHLEADIYPVGKQASDSKLINQDTYELSDDDLKQMDATWLWEDAPNGVDTGLDVVHYLKNR